jgi:hypothetical protein
LNFNEFDRKLKDKNIDNTFQQDISLLLHFVRKMGTSPKILDKILLLVEVVCLYGLFSFGIVTF